MKPVKTHTFNGRKYIIDIDKVDGICEQFKMNPDQRRIYVFAEDGTKNQLITLIHEALHAENWHAGEESVDRTSAEIGTFLWRLGWRKETK